jgi:hypothetical protein
MAEGIPIGAVQRVLHQVAVGTTTAIRGRDSNRAKNAMREIELQFQYEISGTAAATPVFATVTIQFDYALHFAPSARDSTLEYPHFTYGSHTNPAVGVLATVTEWLHDETNGSIVGAVVAIGAIGEGAYKGVAHLTFQGYGSFIEAEPEPEAPEVEP